jgi:hypothetical protein
MKTVQVRKNVFLFFGALSFLTLLLSGCLKETKNAQTPPKSYVSLLHLAPRAPAVTVFFNNSQASQGINPGTVSSAYSPVDPGVFSITFKKVGGDSVVASVGADVYDSLSYYTLLLYNYDTIQVRAVRIEDDFSVLADKTRSYYRFFHMAPDIGPVDLYLDNKMIETGRQYTDNVYSNSYNQFNPATPGSYNLVVKKAGSDSVIAQSYSPMFMGAGAAYTVYLRGIKGGTGANALGIDYLQALD